MESENSVGKSNVGKYAIFIIIGILIIGAIIYFILSKPPVIIEGQRVNISIEGAPVKGSVDAPITMIEFSDYECPFCGRNFLQTTPQIIKNYVETGKVKMVFMDFPLSFHPDAQKASEAALAVRAQLGDEGYWKMHDKLYYNQQSLSIENYKKWAGEIGVNSTLFDLDIDSGKFENQVKINMDKGKKVGVTGTPAFFINGKAIVGACPYSVFSKAFEAEIAGKEWSVDNCVITVV